MDVLTPGIELGTSRTEGCPLTNCAILASPLYNDRHFLEKYTMKDHTSNTKPEKGDQCYIQIRHKDLFCYYNLILRKL